MHGSLAEDSYEPTTNVPAFSAPDWIGRGLHWSDSFPDVVKQQRSLARVIPDIMREQLPDATTTVYALVHEDVVDEDVSLRTGETAKYSSDTPNVSEQEDPRRLFFNLLKHTHHLADLRRTFNNAWLSGSTSIKFPSEPTQRFPMWVENYLQSLQTVLHKQGRWAQRYDWIKNNLETIDNTPLTRLTELAARCDEVLRELPYDSTISSAERGFQISTMEAGRFLGFEWISDEQINAAIACLARPSSHATAVRIVPFTFIQMLERKYVEAQTPYFPGRRGFSPLEKMIQQHALARILVPLHVDGNHWTFVSIDLVNGSMSYADPMRPSRVEPPNHASLMLTWWLSSVLAEEDLNYVFVPRDFFLPDQYDSHSCGVIALTVMAGLSVGPPCVWWTSESPALERMQWFLRLCEGPDVLDTQQDDLDDELDIWDVSPLHAAGRGEAAVPLPHAPLAPSNTDEAAISKDGDPEYLPTSSSKRRRLPQPSSPLIHGSTQRAVSPEDILAAESAAKDLEDLDSGDDAELTPKRKRPAADPDTVPSASWEYQKALATKARQNKAFRLSQGRLTAFRAKILDDDPYAEFNDDDLFQVRCSACGGWIEMRVLFDLLRWREHRRTLKCTTNRQKGLRSSSLLAFGFARQDKSCRSTGPSLRRCIQMPCMGLVATTAPDDKLMRYIRRTTSAGGGAPSRTALALELYETCYKDLTAAQQRVVLTEEALRYQWTVSRQTSSVRAQNCLRSVECYNDESPEACVNCVNLRSNHIFQNALNRAMPSDNNFKYTPKGYRGGPESEVYLKYEGVRDLVENRKDSHRVWYRFVEGCINGTYKNSGVALGMIEAMVLKAERQKHGKTLANMSYSPGFSEFCSILASTSPRAFRSFRNHFGGPSVRSMQRTRARAPTFRPGISAVNINAIANTLAELRYTGPVALAWDDTSIEGVISLCKESSDTYAVMGSRFGIFHISNENDLDEVLNTAGMDVANKVRIWTLVIPLPRIPPLLVAAHARDGTESAEDLLQLHNEICEALHARDIHPISGSADGTETERATQRLIVQTAPSYLQTTIPNDVAACSIELKIPLAYGHFPIVMCQDSKHALKTARNNLFSGARMLVFGFFAAFYALVLAIAKNPASPLFWRDVWNPDRQDDKAAARLYAGETLDFHMQQAPTEVGLSIYLFVFGELVDAWQSRSLSHQERAKMVMRTRFFLLAWRQHIIEHPNYSLSTHFISREYYDISMTLCDSLLSLQLVHRRYFMSHPLLPWLHSTEVCEHIFGILRQLKADFTYADLLHLVPKMRTLLLGAFGDLSAEEKTAQTAAGYHHTYFRADDLDTFTLLCQPSDDEYAELSKSARLEAEQLLAAAGINAKAMFEKAAGAAATTAPAVAAEASEEVVPDPSSDRQSYSLFEDDSFSFKTRQDEELFHTFVMAMVSDSVDKSLEIMSLPDSGASDFDKMMAELEAWAIPADLDVDIPPPPIQPLFALTPVQLTTNNTLDRAVMVAERKRHQTKFTTKALRKNGRVSMHAEANGQYTPPTQDATQASNEPPPPSMRKRLEELLAQRLGSYMKRGSSSTSAVAREYRWTGKVSGDGPDNDTRQKNKATLQDVHASRVLQLRATAFAPLLHIHEMMPYANITKMCPMIPGHYAIVLYRTAHGKRVGLAQIITMYTKSEGRGARHELASSITSVGQPSYVYARVFQSMGTVEIQTTLTCTSLACPTITQIPATDIVFAMGNFGNTFSGQSMSVEGGMTVVLLNLSGIGAELLSRCYANEPALVQAAARLAHALRQA
ncbi:hypothetical protein EV121DRAFT_211101 [Schizophyllum commune]